MPKTTDYYQTKYNTLKLYYDAKVHIKEGFSGETLRKLSNDQEYFPHIFNAIKPPADWLMEQPQFTAVLRLFMGRNCHSKTDWGHLRAEAALLVSKILSETNYPRIANCEKTTRLPRKKKAVESTKSHAVCVCSSDQLKQPTAVLATSMIENNGSQQTPSNRNNKMPTPPTSHNKARLNPKS